MHFQWFCPTFHCFCALPRSLSLPQAVPFLFFSGHYFKSLELAATRRGGPTAASLPWQCASALLFAYKKYWGGVWAGGAEKKMKKGEVEGQEKRECQRPAAFCWGYEAGKENWGHKEGN